MKEDLLALYAVQQLDTALDTLKRRFAAMDPGRAEKAEYDTARAAHEAAEAELHRLQAEQRDAEMERASVEQKRLAEEKKLYGGSIRGAKELMNLQEEVEALARQVERLDAKIAGLHTAVSEAEARENEAKQVRAHAATALKKVNTTYKEEAERMQAQGRELAAQRKLAAALVSPALMKRYEAIRPLKAGIAIAAIGEGNSCEGCRMAVPLASVRRAKLATEIVLCDNCERILCPPAK